MISVDYNEYKKTIAENMELIVENDKLEKEIEKLQDQLQQKENIIKKAYNLADVLYSNYYSSAGKDMSEIFERLLDILYKGGNDNEKDKDNK